MARSRDYPSDRAIQWGDLDRTGQTAMHGVMRDFGKMQSRSGPIIEKLEASKAKSSPKRVAALSSIQPALRDRPVTLRGATDRRVEHFVNGSQRSAAEGVDSGAGWYYEHHRDIAEQAGKYDVPVDTAIRAAAAMSPNNSPSNEKAAATAMMGALRGHHADPKDIRRGGVFVEEGWKTLTTPGYDSLNPAPDAPKVRSYRQATMDAVPDTPEHDEYMGRVHHAQDVLSGRQIKGQGRLDLWGNQQSTEGMLSPTRNTAEDTWMNAITMGQNLDVSVGRGNTNVGKTAASDKTLGLDIPKTPAGGKRADSAHPAGEVGSSALLHAYNNEATVRAARRVGEMTGVDHFPAVAMQEVSWTEARRVAGKDPEYSASSKPERVTRPQYKQKPLFE